MNFQAAINSYNKVGLESEVIGADPHRLILMLFDGALLAVGNAKIRMQQNDIPAKGKSISHAIRIIGEGLDASLDKNIGGKLAQDLSSLYGYMLKRLVEANVKNDIAALDEVTRLLTELKDAWASIKPAPSSSPTQGAHNVQLTYGMR
jgi:flagellar secretion chaperone FliS